MKSAPSRLRRAATWPRDFTVFSVIMTWGVQVPQLARRVSRWEKHGAAEARRSANSPMQLLLAALNKHESARDQIKRGGSLRGISPREWREHGDGIGPDVRLSLLCSVFYKAAVDTIGVVGGMGALLQASWMTECVVAAVSLQVLSYHATCSKTEVDKFKVTDIHCWFDTHTVPIVILLCPQAQWCVLLKSNAGYVLLKAKLSHWGLLFAASSPPYSVLFRAMSSMRTCAVIFSLLPLNIYGLSLQ